MKHQKPPLVGMVCILVPTVAFADPGGLTGLMGQVGNLLGSSIPAGDESRSMLQQVFGSFVLDPFAQGSATTSGGVLGAMFGQFNLFIFTVAMIWFAYTSWAALTQTMHEGVLLGQRMSTVWMPIRVAFGAVSLMPVFGGWAFCQALMMIGALLGIAGANTLQQTAIQSISQFQILVNPQNSVAGSTQARDMEQRILKYTLCQTAVNSRNAEIQANIPGSNLGTKYSPTITSGALEAEATSTVSGFDSGGSSIAQPAGTSLIMDFPTDQGTDACGRVELDFYPRGSSSLLGFRIGGIDYSGIQSATFSAHSAALQSVSSTAIVIATGASDPQGTGAYQQAVAKVKSGYFGSYVTLVNANLSQATWDSQAVSGQLMQNMEAGGWATLGGWYETFAEQNEAMNQMIDPAITFTDPQSVEMESDSTYTRFTGGTEAVIDSAKSSGTTTATGNTSLGQWLFGKILAGTAGANATGASQTLNPIIAFKNLGDNAIALAETMFVVVKGVGLVTKVTKFVPGVAGVISSLVGDFAAMLVPAALVLLAAAAMMAFYIPLIPFITWFAALINWFVSVCESMAGSGLWALAHFDAEGEGMGQRASYGYLFLFNNFARPIILTLGFFMASAGVTVLGSFLFKYFGTAVANAQGNSITGLLSIIAYLVIFAMMGITLVNTMFNLSLHMADRVISFVGTGISSSIGHDVENKVAGLFINAAKRGGDAAGKRAAAGLATKAAPGGASSSLVASVKKATSSTPGGSE